MILWQAFWFSYLDLNQQLTALFVTSQELASAQATPLLLDLVDLYIVPLKSSELARSDFCISLAQGLQRLVPCPELSRCAMVPSLQARCDRVLSHLRLP